MQNTEERIMAVNPGSRYMGYAVFIGTEPYDWGIKSLKGRSFEERKRKFEHFLSDIAESYAINSLAIKSLHPARSSTNLDRMAAFVKEWAKRKGISVHGYSAEEIETSNSVPGRLNKAKLMEAVATCYPFLYHDLENARKKRFPYLVRMFEAIALAMSYLSDLEKQKGRNRISINHENAKE